jgi:hypothetical protein
MANAVYPNFLDLLWNAGIDIGADTLNAAILGPGYTYSSAHTDFSDLTDVLGTGALVNVTSTDGVLDADDTTLSGLAVELMSAVVVYDDTTGKLMLFFDSGLGFNADPLGDVTIIWPDDANAKIFPLGGKAA